MTTRSIEETAQALVAAGKGILAADESLTTIGKRFETLGIPSTAETRRAYREMLFTTPGLSEFVSGAILFDETIRQAGGAGRLADMLTRSGIIPGIKVDTGAKPLAACPGETVTEGLDGPATGSVNIRARGPLREVAGRDSRERRSPERSRAEADAHALGRYAALCQEHGAGSDRRARGPHGRAPLAHPRRRRHEHRSWKSSFVRCTRSECRSRGCS